MDDDEAAASDSDIADFLLDEDMIRAMDAIDQTVNPALLNLNGAPQPRDLSQILWFAIFKNDVAEVSRLIEAGAALPGSRVRYGSTALEMADRMGHREVVRLFCRDLNVAARGMGAILNAIHAGNRTTVRVVLEMGMRGIMAGNQLMTEIIFGYVAKYGTEAIFDVLHEYGPFFSWPEYTSWLLEQAADNDNFDVEGAIMRHRQAHLERQSMLTTAAIDLNDLNPNDKDVGTLEDCLRRFCVAFPHIEMRYFWQQEVFNNRIRRAHNHASFSSTPVSVLNY
ncbi:hypothetical protein ASPCAL08032 [Aspergillus calidoustus]|uniref:Ankyrin repeat protein n=1 Tax=Aspergillus calidoustus TaxID=454130 RepID=A0A0U5GUA7_ASPCI|nr:hypothetical protein ASPCAL08032 [Aspergillus calidoustus]